MSQPKRRLESKLDLTVQQTQTLIQALDYARESSDKVTLDDFPDFKAFVYNSNSHDSYGMRRQLVRWRVAIDPEFKKSLGL